MAGRLDDLSWDGMAVRLETVLALSAGWNPVRDPGFQEVTQLLGTNPYLRKSMVTHAGYQYSYGNLLAAYLVHVTENPNSGKAVTPILMLASLGVTFGALRTLGLGAVWCLSLAGLSALNPVSIYQSSSYYIDAQTGPLYTCLAFSALRLLVSPLKYDGVLALAVSFLSLAAAKTSGLFYGVLLDAFFMGFLLFLKIKTP